MLRRSQNFSEMKELHEGIPTLFREISLRCDIPVVLVRSQNYTADVRSQNTTILYILDDGNG